MKRFEIPYVGSFQRGHLFRTGDALNSVWRHIERVGTTDNLARIAKHKGHDVQMARKASLRIRQAVELRKASKGTTALSRPLLLYYAALNLARGILLAQHGNLGHPTHGLRYKSGPTLLSCGAEIMKTGTFGQLTKLLDPSFEAHIEKIVSLRDALAIVTELKGDFHLLSAGHSSIAYVVVSALVNGPTTLRYHIDGITESMFEQRWTQLLPWMLDDCEHHSPHTLRLKNNPRNESDVEDFCRKRLLHDLNHREDAVWLDHVQLDGVLLLPRVSAYLAVLFILSNMCRYEPELLDEATRDPTDLSYVLTTFLDHVERYFPQLILELFTGTGMFFR